MNNNETFTVYILGGDFREFMEVPDMPYLKFSDLSVEQILILSKIALQCGFQIVVMNGRGDDGQAQAGPKL